MNVDSSSTRSIADNPLKKWKRGTESFELKMKLARNI